MIHTLSLNSDHGGSIDVNSDVILHICEQLMSTISKEQQKAVAEDVLMCYIINMLGNVSQLQGSARSTGGQCHKRFFIEIAISDDLRFLAKIPLIREGPGLGQSAYGYIALSSLF